MHLRASTDTGRSARLRIALALALAMLAGGAAAQGALQRIAASGRIALGVHDDLVPVSYLGPEGRHVGFHVEVCERIVAALRTQLGMPQLAATWVPATMGSRQALVHNRTVDMDCGPNPINATTVRQAEFSVATLAVDLVVMTVVGKRIATARDLDGRTVAMVVGGTAPAQLRSRVRAEGIAIREAFGRDLAEVMAMLDDGRVDAIVAPMAFMAAQRSLSEDPLRFVMPGIVLGQSNLGLMFRAGEGELRGVADRVIVELARSGELERLFEKWHQRPIPGLQWPVGVPIHGPQRERFESPGSERAKF